MPHLIPFPGAFAAGAAIFLIVLWDAFESIILPRRVTRRFRLARLFYKSTWRTWKLVMRLVSSRKRREALLGFYGPLSLLVLVAVWAVGLVLGFGLMQYGAGSAVNMTGSESSFMTDIYLSGTTFFTLGLGDVVPRSALARALVVTEAGFGFGFLAAVIGYLPFIYGSFSKREVDISLLDSRAGTPPTAGELLRRHSYPSGLEALRDLLKDWELWAAELMESHLSYPVLAYFRSQHDNQSWIASLTAILDTCALLMVGIEDSCEKQAELTFAIARHAVADLSQVFGTAPRALPHDRLPAEDLRRIRDTLAQHGLKLLDGEDADRRLLELRRMYEPYIHALAAYLNQTLPPWIPQKKGKDNWQTTAWGQSAGLFEKEKDAPHVHVDDHF
ncbi:MAG TPA: potassium channel family protein [Candidatus Acidoferrum sp.]|nr:potassium channel family protein [Candidatus Acidoferrum sp.]